MQLRANHKTQNIINIHLFPRLNCALTTWLWTSWKKKKNTTHHTSDHFYLFHFFPSKSLKRKQGNHNLYWPTGVTPLCFETCIEIVDVILSFHPGSSHPTSLSLSLDQKVGWVWRRLLGVPLSTASEQSLQCLDH